MIVTANPSKEDYGETQYVLKNATRTKDIQVIQNEDRLLR